MVQSQVAGLGPRGAVAVRNAELGDVGTLGQNGIAVLTDKTVLFGGARLGSRGTRVAGAELAGRAVSRRRTVTAAECADAVNTCLTCRTRVRWGTVSSYRRADATGTRRTQSTVGVYAAAGIGVADAVGTIADISSVVADLGDLGAGHGRAAISRNWLAGVCAGALVTGAAVCAGHAEALLQGTSATLSADLAGGTIATDCASDGSARASVPLALGARGTAKVGAAVLRIGDALVPGRVAGLICGTVRGLGAVSLDALAAVHVELAELPGGALGVGAAVAGDEGALIVCRITELVGKAVCRRRAEAWGRGANVASIARRGYAASLPKRACAGRRAATIRLTFARRRIASVPGVAGSSKRRWAVVHEDCTARVGSVACIPGGTWVRGSTIAVQRGVPVGIADAIF